MQLWGWEVHIENESGLWLKTRMKRRVRTRRK
jgi:hypothetical protein